MIALSKIPDGFELFKNTYKHNLLIILLFNNNNKKEREKSKSFAGFEPTGFPTLVWYGTAGERLPNTLSCMRTIKPLHHTRARRPAREFGFLAIHMPTYLTYTSTYIPTYYIRYPFMVACLPYPKLRPPSTTALNAPKLVGA